MPEGLVTGAEPLPGPSLGQVLLERSSLTEAALERAERVRAQTGERLDLILTRLGLVSEQEVAAALAARLGLPFVPPAAFPEEPVLPGRFNPAFLRQARAIPVEDRAEGLAVAMADPLDEDAAAAMAFVARRPILRRVATPTDVEAAHDRLYGGGRSALGRIADEAAGGEGGDPDDIERLKDLASEAPVVRLVNLLVARAVEARASDIHLEPFEGRLRVRYRTDGVLGEVESPPAHLGAAVVSRVKIMARLDIAERRLPQDGRMRMAVRGQEVDFRVSTTPTLHGESVVLRVLDRSALPLDLSALGMDARALAAYADLLDRPHGILLVTGPTGSGKTTTLYASLARLNSPERKILTVEDPVEYQFEGINQLQVQPSIGRTFAGALRSFLRQDPDIVMVGEIRDVETAQVAVQAALTGHLVLSTLHTNDAAGAVTRLLDMGVDDYLLASAVNGVVAQRLVRRVCPSCRVPHDPAPGLAARLGLGRLAAGGPVRLHRAAGCEACRGTGYAGRTGVAEVLPMSDGIRALVLRRADARAIRDAAVAEGMETMLEAGLRKALAGETTLDEVLRVVALD